MRRVVCITVFLAILALLGNMSVADAATGKKIRVAVFDFENNSTWSWWGEALGARRSN